MGVPDALGGRTLGLPRMGFAVPFGSGPFRALLPGSRQTPQEVNRVGLADAPATQALAASPPDHRRGRWRGYASLKLLDRCRHLKNPIAFITRLRIDAALYEPA